MKTVIFDLDGTLADTSGDLIDAANACFRALGHGDMLDMQADKACSFAGGRAMLRLGFLRLGQPDAEGLIDEQFPFLLEHYGENLDRYTMVYDGVRPAIQRLLDAGYRVGICTNKPEGLAEALMQRLGMRDMFGALVGADTLPTRKPDAAPYLVTNAFTLAPVPGAIASVGAVPVFVGVTEVLTIDLSDLEQKIAESGARVLLLSHMRGHICDMEALID